MYRTYRELYRSKTEITTIGKGAGALKLGKYMAVGLDIILFGIIIGIFPGIFLAGILHMFYRPFPTLLWQIVIGLVAGWAASQFDPQGKSVLTWIIDLIAYFIRKHLTDGFNKEIKMDSKAPLYRYAFYAVDQGTARSTPVYGRGTFTLHKPLGAKLKRDGTWVLKRSTHPLPPGRYRVVDGRIKAFKEAPKLKKNA